MKVPWLRLFLRVRSFRWWLDRTLIGGSDCPKGILWRLQIYCLRKGKP